MNIKKSIAIIIEFLFIMFLFYSNLLMSEYTKSEINKHKNLLVSIDNIFTIENFIIAVIAAFISHFVFGYIRKKL